MVVLDGWRPFCLYESKSV